MELLEAVKLATHSTAKRKDIISWGKVQELLNDGRSAEAIRSEYRCKYGDRQNKSKEKTRTNITISISKTHKKGVHDKLGILKEELKKERTLEELCFATSMTDIEVLGHIEKLKYEGYNIVKGKIGDKPYYTYNKKELSTTYYEYKHYHDISKVIRFGLVSDTHSSSNYHQRTLLNLAYDDFEKEGIMNVYHAGDITDGMYSNRAGNIYEIHAYGMDQQKDEVVEFYPKRKGITTYFITGNHDATHMMNGGANIGKAISNERKDLVYLGHEYAKIWLANKVDLDLVHARDGSSYATSYKPQKRIDAMSGGSKPKIMALGHYHKNLYMFYRNIHVLMLSSFQAQSPFLRGMGLVSDVGYSIIELKVNEQGDIIDFNQRYKPFYKMVENDY